MDSTSSFSEFFYNLVPGALFVTVLWLLFFPPLVIDQPTSAIVLVVLGLFFGFLFQAITSLLRNFIFFGEGIYGEFIKNEGSKLTYNTAVKILLANKLISKGNNTANSSIRSNLHLMDNFLRAKKFKSTTEHFAAKSAFWSNICIGTFIIILLIVPIHYGYCLFLGLVVFVLFTYLFSRHYYILQYDVVIKTFVSVIKLEKQYKEIK
ncbi:MAG: hypothetical protein HY426_01365 [Candidatus Levybacteria bacterium]|nr:hypothetical protein [Candidatus Levybacteria bacterium]